MDYNHSYDLKASYPPDYRALLRSISKVQDLCEKHELPYYMTICVKAYDGIGIFWSDGTSGLVYGHNLVNDHIIDHKLVEMGYPVDVDAFPGNTIPPVNTDNWDDNYVEDEDDYDYFSTYGFH